MQIHPTPIEGLSDTAQIKGVGSIENEKILFSDSFKASGFFSWLGSRLGFAALFRSSAAQKQFKNGYEQVKQAFAEQYKETFPNIEIAFDAKFENRFKRGSPLTVGSIKIFLKEHNLRTDDNVVLKNLEHRKEMVGNYQNIFYHGQVEKKSTEALKKDFFSASPLTTETKTILSPDSEMKSLSQMRYLTTETNPDYENCPDTIVPSGGCVQILGTQSRAQLLEQALYEPTSRKKEVKEIQKEAERKQEETATRLTDLRASMSLVNNDPQASLQIKDEIDIAQVQAEYHAAQLKKLADVDSWPPQKLAAYAQMHALVSKARSAPGEKSKEINNLKKQKQDLENSLSLSSPQSEKLQTKLAKLTIDITTAQTELEKLIQRCNEILSKSRDWESWNPEKMLQFIHTDRIEPIQFDRIKVKVNGTFLNFVSDSNTDSFNINFAIFKQALNELAPGVVVNEQHFREMLSLCSKDKTTQGTPSGAHTAEDKLPSFGQKSPLKDDEINFYEIVLSPDKQSFDFKFDSNKALLNRITYQGGPSAALSPSFTYTNSEEEIAPNSATTLSSSGMPLFERRCKFTWRYTPVTDSKGGNMGFGNLDLIDSRQGFWPFTAVQNDFSI